LTAGTLGSVAVGLILPFTPLGRWFGFTPLPLGFLAILAVMVIVYLALVEVGKSFFFGRTALRPPLRIAHWTPPEAVQRVERIASRWSVRPRQWLRSGGSGSG
jgi:Mg2+-importing ATPase